MQTNGYGPYLQTVIALSSFMQNFVSNAAKDYKAETNYQSTCNRKISWVDLREIATVKVEVLLYPGKYLNQTLIIIFK